MLILFVTLCAIALAVVVEAVRNLRTSILLSSIDRTPKLIMMTSSISGEARAPCRSRLRRTSPGWARRCW